MPTARAMPGRSRSSLADRAIDAVLVLNCPTALASADDAARAVIATSANAAPLALAGRNVLTAWLGESTAAEARRLFSAAHIATYETPDSAVRGFMHRVHYRRNQELLDGDAAGAARGAGPRRAARCRRDRASRRRRTAMARCRRGGGRCSTPIAFPCPACRVVADAAAAAKAAAEIGGPVALKIRSPDITHKSDVGGVALNLGGPDRVRREAEAMLARVAAARAEGAARGLPGAADDATGRAPWNSSSASSRTRSSDR